MGRFLFHHRDTENTEKKAALLFSDYRHLGPSEDVRMPWRLRGGMADYLCFSAKRRLRTPTIFERRSSAETGFTM